MTKRATKSNGSSEKRRQANLDRTRLLDYFLSHPDQVLPNRELRVVLGEERGDSWTRRLRELRSPRYGSYIIHTRQDRKGLGSGDYWFPKQERKAPVKVVRISNKLRGEVFDRDAYSCQGCGLSRGEFYEDGRRVVLQVGHNIAESHGGEVSLENCITLCVRCNQAESNVGPDRPTLSKTMAQVRRLPNHERKQIFDYLKNMFQE